MELFTHIHEIVETILASATLALIGASLAIIVAAVIHACSSLYRNP